MFLSSDDQFEDYSCPPAVIAKQIQQYMDMAKPMQMMLKNMNQGQDNPMFDLALDIGTAFGKIQGVFSEDYDGGEFCRGLIFAKEASKVVF